MRAMTPEPAASANFATSPRQKTTSELPFGEVTKVPWSCRATRTETHNTTEQDSPAGNFEGELLPVSEFCSTVAPRRPEVTSDVAAAGYHDRFENNIWASRFMRAFCSKFDRWRA